MLRKILLPSVMAFSIIATQQGWSTDALEPHQDPSVTKKLLTLDGGGIRGVIEAAQLATIEKLTGQPINELVEVLGGTSTGGILAGGLAAGISAQDLLKIYTKNGREIFKKDASNHVNFAGWWNVQYSASSLEEILNILIKDTAFSTDSLKNRLFLTGYSMSAGKNILADSSDRQWSVNPLTRLLRMTSAAPTYFNPIEIKQGTGEIRSCVDGGLYANNPVKVITDALILEHARANPGQATALAVYSLGTGDTFQTLSPGQTVDRSTVSMIAPLLEALFNSDAQKADQDMRQMLELEECYGDSHRGLWLSEYHRIQPELSDPKTHVMDDVSPANIAKLLERGFDMTKTADFQELLLSLTEKKYSTGDIEKAIAAIQASLKTIDLQKTDYPTLVGIINDYINGSKSGNISAKDFFENLLPADYIKSPDFQAWVEAMLKANTKHDSKKSTYSTLWGYVVTGKHAKIKTALEAIKSTINSNQ
ncbi:MAG: patatin-like phospholipase family protein [Pseudomonadota bacterium]